MVIHQCIQARTQDFVLGGAQARKVNKVKHESRGCGGWSPPPGFKGRSQGRIQKFSEGGWEVAKFLVKGKNEKVSLRYLNNCHKMAPQAIFFAQTHSKTG